MSEDFLDELIMEERDLVKSAIRDCAPSGDQYMDLGWNLMQSQKVWITDTTPGIRSKPVAACKNFTSERIANRQKLLRIFSLNRN